MLALKLRRAVPITFGLMLILAVSAGVLIFNNWSITRTRSNPSGEFMSSDELSDARSLKSKTEERMLDFEKLRSFIKNFVTEYGAFPLGQSGDEFINATYYGYMALYLLGEYEFLKDDKVRRALDYFHDEKTGGFRESFGGEPTLRATLWGILIYSSLNISSKDFNLLSSLRFVNNTLSNTSIEELDLIDAALLLNIASRHREVISNENLTVIETFLRDLPQYILDFYDESIRLFKDSRVSLSPLVQTHLVLEAMTWYNSSTIDPLLAESIAYGVLYCRYNLTDKKLQGGFGYKEPTVFETGLSTDILFYISEKVDSNAPVREIIKNETFWSEVFAFINNSQLKTGGIARNPASSKVDVFQIFGALLAYLAKNRLKNYLELSITVKPSIQIPIDYNGSIIIEITAKYFKKYLPLLVGFAMIYNSITKETYNISAKQEGTKYLIIPTQVMNYTFGNYNTTIYLWKNVSLSALSVNSSLYFRIGYNLSLSLSKTIICPGEDFNVTVSAKFYNGTPVNGSTFILSLLRTVDGSIHMQKFFEMNGTDKVTISCKSPINASLGEYAILVVVNDTYGFNHTFAKEVIQIDDDVIYGEIVGKTDKYYVGGRILIEVRNLTYNSTKVPIPTDPTVSLEVRYRGSGMIYSKLNGSIFYDENENQTIVQINASLSPIIPKDLNVSLYLMLEWDKSPTGVETVKLFNASLILEELDIINMTVLLNNSLTPISESKLYIGGSYDIHMQLVHIFNTSYEVLIENASITAYISYLNKSWSKSDARYNSSLKSYQYTLYADPNLPELLHNLTIRVYLEFNSSYKNLTKSVYILGRPEVIDWSMPSKTHVGEYFFATFRLICSETGEILKNVSMLANITLKTSSRNRTVTAPVVYTNTTYCLSLYAEFTSNVEGIIYRSTDNLSLFNFSTKFFLREKPFVVDPWMLPMVIIMVSYVSFITLRGKYLRRIPKRFIIERRV
ncbi:MAG: hypothetical protein NDP22_03580 [Crenarchaeota archaeon]|nr:hypothetical protein [Thermoproteota archaeon]